MKNILTYISLLCGLICFTSANQNNNNLDLETAKNTVIKHLKKNSGIEVVSIEALKSNKPIALTTEIREKMPLLSSMMSMYRDTFKFFGGPGEDLIQKIKEQESELNQVYDAISLVETTQYNVVMVTYYKPISRIKKEVRKEIYFIENPKTDYLYAFDAEWEKNWIAIVHLARENNLDNPTENYDSIASTLDDPVVKFILSSPK